MLRKLSILAVLFLSLSGCATTGSSVKKDPTIGVYSAVVQSAPVRVPPNETLVVCEPVLKGQNAIMYYLSNSFPCDTSLVAPVKAVCITDVYGVFQIINEFEQQNYKCNKFKGTQK